jgi:integrase/recombinase XerD
MIKMLIFTGLRNIELARVWLQDVDLDQCHIRVVQGKRGRDRTVLVPTSFRGDLLQYMQGAQTRRAVHPFESNRLRPYSTAATAKLFTHTPGPRGLRNGWIRISSDTRSARF